MQLFYAFFFCMTLLLPCSSHLEAATLHAIVAGDTYDRSIGESVKVDIERLKREIRHIAAKTDLDLKLHVFKGENYQAKSIESCIHSLDVSSDDIVLYFHSSHGLRLYSMGLHPLPILAFPVSDSIYLRDIVQLIKRKEPRFSLVLADCCNSWTPDFYAPSILQVCYKLPSDISEEIQRDQYQRLFLEPRGMVILLGSAAGGTALCNRTFGGFCTFYWTQSLDRFSKKFEPITWKDILEDTKMWVKNISRTQPDFGQNVWYSVEIDTEEKFSTPMIQGSAQGLLGGYAAKDGQFEEDSELIDEQKMDPNPLDEASSELVAME